MKLLFCKECGDVFSLDAGTRACQCGQSGGRYKDDGLHAEFWGEAVPLGIDNISFARALRRQPDAGQGRVFEAFVIPRSCETFVRKEPRK